MYLVTIGGIESDICRRDIYSSARTWWV